MKNIVLRLLVIGLFCSGMFLAGSSTQVLADSCDATASQTIAACYGPGKSQSDIDACISSAYATYSYCRLSQGPGAPNPSYPNSPPYPPGYVDTIRTGDPLALAGDPNSLCDTGYGTWDPCKSSAPSLDSLSQLALQQPPQMIVPEAAPLCYFDGTNPLEYLACLAGLTSN